MLWKRHAPFVFPAAPFTMAEVAVILRQHIVSISLQFHKEGRQTKCMKCVKSYYWSVRGEDFFTGNWRKQTNEDKCSGKGVETSNPANEGHCKKTINMARSPVELLMTRGDCNHSEKNNSSCWDTLWMSSRSPGTEISVWQKDWKTIQNDKFQSLLLNSSCTNSS